MVSIERGIREMESQSVAFGRKIKERLQRSFDVEPVAPPTQIGSLEDLITKARETVTHRWKTAVSDVVEKEIADWLPLIANDARGKRALEVLTDPQVLETKLSIRQFSDLDILRKVYPQAWYSLVRASMERQHAELAVLSSWTDTLPPSVFERLGTTKDGFALALEIAQTTGPLINETFMQQMKLADLPHGSEQTPHAATMGAEYIYEVKQPDGTYKVVPYIDMFPLTWPKLVQTIQTLSEKTQQLVSTKRVPPEYTALSLYLSTVASVYGSQETDFSKLYALWQGLEHAVQTYFQSKCPIILSTQAYSYVTGDAGKVDAEFRVALETSKTKAYEYMVLPYQKIAEKFACTFDRSLAKPSKPIVVRFQEMLYGTGSNTFWRTQGESSEKIIDIYVDSGEDVAFNMAIPIYERVFGKQLDTRAQTIFVRNYVESLAVHELGHTVLSDTDESVKSRVGSGVGFSMIEELKADTVGMKIFWERMKNTWDMDHAKRMLETLVTYSLEYILNRTSADGHGTSMYGDGGAVILSHLLNAGALKKSRTGVYEIHDAAKGFSALLAIAEYICVLYADPQTTPERIEQYAKYLNKHKENPKLQELLVFAKS